MEKIKRPVSGYVALLFALALIAVAIYLATMPEQGWRVVVAIVLFLTCLFAR